MLADRAELERKSGDGYEQNTLYSCIKFPKNKYKNI